MPISKITFLTDKINLSRGGSNQSLDLLARELSNRGICVDIITTNIDAPNQIPDNRSYTFSDQNLAGDSRIQTIKQTLSALEQVESDLIHVFAPGLAPIAALFARSSQIPVVCRLNTYSLFCSNTNKMNDHCYLNCSLSNKVRHASGGARTKVRNFPKFIFDDLFAPHLIKYIDQFFALSPAARDVYIANGIPKSKISIVPNFYNPDFTEIDPTRQFMSENVDQILYVGRLTENKGVDVLINAVSELESQPHVDIIGDGFHRDQIEESVSDNHLIESVTFHGWVEHTQLPKYYQKSDIFVHPGRWPEPFGRTILEALQCGCLPIVSDVGAPPWIVDDHNLTFAVGNSPSLASRIEKVNQRDQAISNTSLYSRLADFSPESVLQTLMSEYETVVRSN